MDQSIFSNKPKKAIISIKKRGLPTPGITHPRFLGEMFPKTEDVIDIRFEK